MNIMLVSVSERAREIGLRRAVGATPTDVLAQFLVEALVLTIGGAVVGLALGALGADLLTELLGWPTRIGRASVVGALGMALGVGLCSGLYPALKAAALDPIRALRSA
jgi:putative ABC transport system permease protein